MSETFVSHIIRKARNLIADPDRWTQRELARTAAGEGCKPWDPQAVAFCAYGALIKAAYGTVSDAGLAMRFAQSATATLFWPAGSDPVQLYEINDHEGWEAVLELFDRRLEEQRSCASAAVIENRNAEPLRLAA